MQWSSAQMLLVQDSPAHDQFEEVVATTLSPGEAFSAEPSLDLG